MDENPAGWFIPISLMLLLFALVSPMLAPLASTPDGYTGGLVTFRGESGHVSLDAELAVTPQEHSRGLMNRESLADGQGMLFIFSEDSPRSFWMKDTLIPLDMVFVNSSMHVVGVVENAQPCTASCSCQCPRHSSEAPAMYVIEANAGFCREHGIKEGQLIDIELLQS